MITQKREIDLRSDHTDQLSITELDAVIGGGGLYGWGGPIRIPPVPIKVWPVGHNPSSNPLRMN
jgi:hypothetical protein